MTCPLCERNLACANKTYPYLIHEFKHSYFVLGEHQFYKGYCLLISKEHHKEMTDLSAPTQIEFFQEMMQVSRIIQEQFAPDKLNTCSLGNIVPHIHWHFFPRYHSDSLFKNPPWLQMHLFDSAKISPEQAAHEIKIIKEKMRLLGIG